MYTHLVLMYTHLSYLFAAGVPCCTVMYLLCSYQQNPQQGTAAMDAIVIIMVTTNAVNPKWYCTSLYYFHSHSSSLWPLLFILFFHFDHSHSSSGTHSASTSWSYFSRSSSVGSWLIPSAPSLLKSSSYFIGISTPRRGCSSSNRSVSREECVCVCVWVGLTKICVWRWLAFQAQMNCIVGSPTGY